ncbi:hypothetical protein AU825_16325 [Salmonella enterica subsp. salamae]|nr:hypothetical protein [Salmonella enterica subsp. salamae]ECF6094451.1 hypothetical protein [Salmonella enterica subsp. salamae]EDW5991514.1 hypothetical protein [Salmonella enterica subsp. salamae]
MPRDCAITLTRLHFRCLTRRIWPYRWSHAVALALFGVVCKFLYSNRRTFSKHKICKLSGS